MVPALFELQASLGSARVARKQPGLIAGCMARVCAVLVHGKGVPKAAMRRACYE